MLIDNRDPFVTVCENAGTTFVVRRVADAQLFKIAALIGAGSLNDNVSGTAHFFEHLPFNMTANFKDGAIFRYFEDRGGFVNAFTGYDSTVYYGQVQREHFRDGIAGVAELIRNPIFDTQRIVDEAKTIVTEWAMRQGIQGIQRYARNRRATLGENDPHEVIGNPESIRSITAQNIGDFYQQHYVSDNLIVYMQGDMSPNELMDEAVKQFSLPRGLITEMPAFYDFQPSTLHVELPDTAATHATLLFKGVPLGAEPTIDQVAKICGQMLCSIDGRLLKEARFEKRLVYGVGLTGDRTRCWGFEGLEFDIFPEQMAEMCEIVMRHLTNMSCDPDPQLFEAMRKTRAVGIGEFLRTNREQDPKEQVQMIAATGIIYPQDAYLTSLTSITPQSIADYTREHYGVGPLSVIYEGGVNSNFPNHQALHSIRQPPRPAPRNEVMDQRVLGHEPPCGVPTFKL